MGHIIDSNRIRVNPKKMRNILDLPRPRNLKGLQSLHGILAALSRFLSRAGEKQLPFFQILVEYNKTKKYEWLAYCIGREL